MSLLLDLAVLMFFVVGFIAIRNEMKKIAKDPAIVVDPVKAAVAPVVEEAKEVVNEVSAVVEPAPSDPNKPAA